MVKVRSIKRLDMPDIVCVFSDRTVGGKEACLSDIIKSFFIPKLTVGIIVKHNIVGLEVGLKVSKTHIRVSNAVITDDKVVKHICK